MFALDIETLGIESTAVILSIGIVYVPDMSPRSYQEVIDNAIFVKLDPKDQIENYGRTVDKGTIEWWKKQGDVQRKRSFLPSKNDVSVLEAIDLCQRWVKSQPEQESMVWTRGSLDGTCMDSLFIRAGHKALFPYNQYRDVRTAIDIIYSETSKNGYVDVDPDKCPGWDRDLVLKHSPEHDAAYDLCMLLFGKQ